MHYPKEYAYRTRRAGRAKDPLQKLELRANAVEAKSMKEHWERLVIRGLNDLLVSFHARDCSQIFSFYLLDLDNDLSKNHRRKIL